MEALSFAVGLRVALLLLACFGVVLFVLALSAVPVLPAPRKGYRGVVRSRELARSSLFRLADPLVRWFGGLVSVLLRRFPEREKLRQAQARRLEQAGDYLGWAPEELTGAMLLGMLLGSLVGTLASVWLEQGMLYLVLGVLGGPFVVALEVQSVARQRMKSVARQLPAGIDIAALCTSAGMDFPSSLAMVVNEAPAGDALGEELQRVLDAMKLGQTRREALAAFDRRVPIAPVRDLVRALTQAEEKGTPIAEALLTQAAVNRAHRTVLAEESATRAGVLLIIPMVLLLGCILLLLMGPLLVAGAAL
jgi:pilus assembly protein TadC